MGDLVCTVHYKVKHIRIATLKDLLTKIITYRYSTNIHLFIHSVCALRVLSKDTRIQNTNQTFYSANSITTASGTFNIAVGVESKAFIVAIRQLTIIFYIQFELQPRACIAGVGSESPPVSRVVWTEYLPMKTFCGIGGERAGGNKQRRDGAPSEVLYMHTHSHSCARKHLYTQSYNAHMHASTPAYTVHTDNTHK